MEGIKSACKSIGIEIDDMKVKNGNYTVHKLDKDEFLYEVPEHYHTSICTRKFKDKDFSTLYLSLFLVAAIIGLWDIITVIISKLFV